jgi:hypothetical protein
VCVDQERAVYAVDLVEWFVSWFQRPIKRPLSLQQPVLVVKHLRSAARRLPVVRMPDAARARLRELLRSAQHHTEAKLRDRLRPLLAQSLDQVGLTPGHFVERIARDKLIEELLDHIVASGFLTIGDLRDALARNRLKLPDLAGPVEFVTGDPLIRANRQLAVTVDGVYRRGEIYLRWLQRLSSIFFGTRIGRLLTLYLLLPLGLAFFVLKGIDGLFEEEAKYLGVIERVARALGHVPATPPATSQFPDLAELAEWFGLSEADVTALAEEYGLTPPDRPAHPPPLIHLFNVYSFAAVSLFVLLLLHVPPFRRAVLRGLIYSWRGLRGLFYDFPHWLLRLPLLRRILQSRAYLLFYEHVFKPALVAAAVAAGLWLFRVSPSIIVAVTAGTFVVACVLINSRLGLYLEEWWADSLVRTWHLLSRDLFPGLLRFIMWLSHVFLERVDWLLYTVDEWLRFRTGEGRLAFASKLVLGFLWFWVTYVVRFAVNLLIEPQVNPVKHFPVVTVSHKLMLLLVKPIAARVQPLFGWPLLTTEGVVAGFLGLIPGIFGFLAWELKENWKLYRANQSATLDPVMVGSHGEWVIHLIRPGFHSGTIPKLYGKLRRSRGRAARRAEEALHHVEEGLYHFVERDLVALLSASPSWGRSASLAVGHVQLGTYRIRVELCNPSEGAEGLLLDFENRGGWLVAGIARAGWVARLAPEQRSAFVDGLAGFYKLAGVDLVREQIEAALPPGATYEVTEEGLVVRGADGVRLVCDPRDPSAPCKEMLFRARPILWEEWARCWDQDQAGKGHGEGLLPGVRLLPAA